jgi:hypothetical protein
LERQPKRTGSAGVDFSFFFDVPFQLSKSIIGFRPDEGRPDAYEVLAINAAHKAAPKKWWFKKLFGGNARGVR